MTIAEFAGLTAFLCAIFRKNESGRARYMIGLAGLLLLALSAMGIK